MFSISVSDVHCFRAAMVEQNMVPKAIHRCISSLSHVTGAWISILVNLKSSLRSTLGRDNFSLTQQSCAVQALGDARYRFFHE